MAMRRFVIALSFMVILFPAAVLGQNQVSWEYELFHDSGDQYTYMFHLDNLGPGRDAIFKIQLDAPGDASKWKIVNSVLPTGWDDKSSGSSFNAQTANGNLGSGNFGAHRIWGESGTDTPPAPGNTSGTFSWTFLRNGGMMPTVDLFKAGDAKIHLQTIDSNWQNSGNTYPVTPVTITLTVVPEPSNAMLILGALPFASLLRKRIHRGPASGTRPM